MEEVIKKAELEQDTGIEIPKSVTQENHVKPATRKDEVPVKIETQDKSVEKTISSENERVLLTDKRSVTASKTVIAGVKLPSVAKTNANARLKKMRTSAYPTLEPGCQKPPCSVGRG